jgi:hypothetical protein
MIPLATSRPEAGPSGPVVMEILAIRPAVY